METIKLKSLYSVDTISQDKGWKKVHDAVLERYGNGQDIMIDFSETTVIEPWSCKEFIELLKMNNVHMKFLNSEGTVNRIKMMCCVIGVKEDRFENTQIEVPKKKSTEEIKIEQYGKALIPSFVIENDTATFDMTKKYSQIHNSSTFNNICYAIEEINKDKGIEKFVLVMGNIFNKDTYSNIIQALAEKIVKYSLLGIDIKVDINDEEAQKNLMLFIHSIKNKVYTDRDRYTVLRKTLKDKTAGMLIKYKKSKALDELGRQGKGQIVSCRIAVFQGFKIGEESVKMVIDSYSDNLFYTKAHWAVDHDFEELDSLEPERIEIPMNEVGFADLFLGSRYHFIYPIQDKINESRTIILDIDEEGKNIKAKVTIPERMKYVFDDWGVDYNKEELEEAIQLTKVHLAEQENQLEVGNATGQLQPVV